MECSHLCVRFAALCITFLFSCGEIAYACTTTTTTTTTTALTNKTFLNIIMLIDSGAGGEYTSAQKGEYEAITGRLHDALIQCSSATSSAIIIVSPAMLHCLALINQKAPNRDFYTLATDWQTYLNKQEDLAMLVPKQLPPFLHAGINFSPKIINEVSTENNLSETFAQKKYYCTPYNAAHCEQIMDLIDLDKIVYLSGHGFHNYSIADMTTQKYQKTLQIFNKSKVKFLYITSCLAGGRNLLLMHNLINGPVESFNAPVPGFSLSSIHYPIAIAAVTDAEQFMETTPQYLPTIFSAISNYLQLNTLSENTNTYRILQQLAQALYNTMPYLNNIPLIRLPQQGVLFRAVSLEQAYALTASAYLSIKKKINNNSSLLAAQKTVLVYPVSLEGITIHAQKTHPFISMIPGTSQHYIPSIQSDSTVRQTIEKLFCRPLSQNGFTGYYNQAAKAWFVERIVCSKETATGIVIHKEEADPTTYAEFTVLYKSGNKYLRYRVEGILGLRSPEEISATTYLHTIANIQESTHALPEAIHFATNGRSTNATENVAFNHFVQAITSEQPTKASCKNMPPQKRVQNKDVRRRT